MNRVDRINEFLMLLRDLALQNPHFLTTKNEFYSLLIYKDIINRHTNEKFFETLINRYKKNPKINVLIDPKFKYFCQFLSNDDKAKSTTEHIKVYIPLDENHIEQGSNMIFDFLSENNISHLSKIGKDTRIDDIVIRLVDKEDAIKLINFVSSNNYIQEGLLKPNPFALNVNNIAIACDGRISYNSTVATLLQLYIADKRKENTLNEVNVNDFYEFINNYYKKVFVNKTHIHRLKTDFDVDINNKKVVINYMNVLELILKARNNDFSFTDFLVHYSNCKNNEIKDNKQSKFYETKKMSDVELNNMTKEIIQTLLKMYKDERTARNYLSSYICYNDERYLTREYGLREKVINSNYRQSLLKYLKEHNLDFNGYIQNLNITKKEESTNITDMLKEVISVMSIKKGKDYAVKGVIAYIKTGNENYITRTNDMRIKVVELDLCNKVNDYLIKNNISLQTLINNILNNVNKENILISSIETTYKKYEELYKQGKCVYNGRNIVLNALKKYLISGNPESFTRDNSARENIIKYLTKEEALKIVLTSLNIDLNNKNIDYSNINESYINLIIKKENLKLL